MSLVNNSANNFKDFLDAIKPYLNYQFYDMSGQGVEANNFSTDEKVIGTWIDGKPLYQKTVNCGALPINTNKIVAHNISNIGNVVFASGFAFNSSANVSLCIGYTATSSDRKADIGILVNRTSIEIRTYRESVSSYTESYVTLRYTKTTDSPVASGEKIVGQWIDGKPIYQKSFAFTNITTANVNVEVDLTDLTSYGIDKFLYCEGSVTTTTSATWTGLLPGHFDNDHYYQVYYGTDKKLKLTGHIDWWVSGTGHADVYVTIRYTKTT